MKRSRMYWGENNLTCPLLNADYVADKLRCQTGHEDSRAVILSDSRSPNELRRSMDLLQGSLVLLVARRSSFLACRLFED